MIIPVGYAQVNFIFSGEGYKRGAQVTLGVENGADQSAEAIATTAKTHWVEHILPEQNNEIQLATVKCKLGPNEDGPEFLETVAIDGGVAGAGLPPNVGLLVSKKTALGGRKNRGRWFLPGLSESDQDTAGYLSTARLDVWDTAVTAFKNSMNTSGYELVILHNAVGTPTEITLLQVQALFATQKRRIRRAGGRRSPVLA